MEDTEKLGPWDITVLVGYFVLIGVILVAVSRHQSKTAGGSSTESYFLAERSVSWWAVAASLFASNIGSEHFVGLAGGAASSGVVMGFFEVGAIPVLIATGLFFLPIYLNAKVQTTPDYLEMRYSRFCRTVMVAVSLSIYVFSRISATLYAGELILTELVNVDKLVAVILLVTFTALYTVLGGLEAVIYTEALQTAVLLIGGMMMVFFALDSVNGFSGLTEQLRSMEEVPENFLHFFHPPSDPVAPWTGFLFGFYVYVPWYFGVDQVIVQRALAAKDVAHGQLGCVVAACFKFIPFFIMVVPGLCARVLVPQRLSADELEVFQFDKAFPWMVINVIPINQRGVIVASMLSSLMSALASVFNSAGTLFALNIWRVWYPETSEKNLVTVGRVTVVVLAVVAIAWLPILPLMGKSLFTIINKPLAYLAPPIFCLYIWGMLSRLPNQKSGEWTLIFGIVMGGARFLLEVLEDVAGTKMFGVFTSVNYMHFAGLSFWFCSLLLFSLSLVTRKSTLAGDDGLHRIDKELLFRPNLYDELMENSKQDSSIANEIRSEPRNAHGRHAVRTSSFGSEADDRDMMVELSLQDVSHFSSERRSYEDRDQILATSQKRLSQDEPLSLAPSIRDEAENQQPIGGPSQTTSSFSEGADQAEIIVLRQQETWIGKQTIWALSSLVLLLWLVQVIILG